MHALEPNRLYVCLKQNIHKLLVAFSRTKKYDSSVLHPLHAHTSVIVWAQTLHLPVSHKNSTKPHREYYSRKMKIYKHYFIFRALNYATQFTYLIATLSTKFKLSTSISPEDMYKMINDYISVGKRETCRD